MSSNIFMCMIIVLLTISALGLLGYKLWHYRRRLHDLISNPRWENYLDNHNIFECESIVFFGDSQIELWRISPLFGITPIRNRGISGELAEDALKRFSTDVVRLKPKLVLFLSGANDLAQNRSVQQILKSIETMILMAKDNSIGILLGNLLPFKEGVYSNHRLGQIHLVNDGIKNLSVNHRIPCIDFYGALSNEKGYMHSHFSDDGLHPNFVGYIIMTKLVFKFIHTIKYEWD